MPVCHMLPFMQIRAYRDPLTSLPRHPDAAIAALEDKFRNRGTPPPAALARIAELEQKKNGN